MTAPPGFWARMLRQQAGVESVTRLDVDALTDFYRIDLCELPVDGFLGLLLRPEEKGIRYGMMIKEGQTPEQRRFTIAHELGHFAIPGHDQRPVEHCLEANIMGVEVSNTTEREANQFAAELLMPASLFDHDIQHRTPSFRHVREIANRYEVSLTACAIRWLERTREPYALVCTEGETIRWKYATKKFPFWLPSPGTKVAEESGAAAVFRGEPAALDPEAVPSWAWIERGHEAVEVMESTFALTAWGQVLSLLQVHERDEDDA